MNIEFRERLLKQLREPNPKADMLIERYLGSPAGLLAVVLYAGRWWP